MDEKEIISEQVLPAGNTLPSTCTNTHQPHHNRDPMGPLPAALTARTTPWHSSPAYPSKGTYISGTKSSPESLDLNNQSVSLIKGLSNNSQIGTAQPVKTHSEPHQSGRALHPHLAMGLLLCSLLSPAVAHPGGGTTVCRAGVASQRKDPQLANLKQRSLSYAGETVPCFNLHNPAFTA